MGVSERSLYFLTKDDLSSPMYAPAGLFEEFENEIPCGWKFALQSGIRASGRQLWSEPRVATWGFAELVEQDEFTDRLFERESQAITVFESKFVLSRGADGSLTETPT
jgi:hypothetical protein